MAGIENYNVMLYTSVLPPETVELLHLPDIHMGPCPRESSRSSIPTSHEQGSRLVCFWPRFIAIQTARTWAVSRANTPATGRSRRQKPIYGRPCSSFLRGVIKPGSTSLNLGNRSFGHSPRKNRLERFLLALASLATLCRY